NKLKVHFFKHALLVQPTSPPGVGVAPTAGTQQPQAAVVTQPPPVPVSVMYLTEIPGLVNCPHCHHTVTTKVTYVPGTAAWCTCVLLALMGLICGFCLIPFAIRGLQDAHHSCPQCRNVLHIYRR
uniref:LITAF domain-containing protein n=1 Tax=Mastacembelus armatus TaxID=205130 RepID=A0A3Q3RYK2_9TELE